MKDRYERRQDAEARQTRYDALTPEGRIAIARRRRGNSAKEIARQQKLLKDSKK
jgi:DNA-binding CsgD family transcriptional regulator